MVKLHIVGADPLEHFQLAILVCQTFGIGDDDLFNIIYVMSHARRHHLTAEDVRAFISLGTGDIGLAGFGHNQYRRPQTAKVGIEQRALFATEISFAAVRERTSRCSHYTRRSWRKRHLT